MSKVKILLFLQLVFFLALPVLAQVDTGWVRRYHGPANGFDVAYDLAVDDSGNVYVTGESYGSGTYTDYATIKYSPAGDTLWVRRYNGPGNGDDRASALAVDDSGNVYVTGHNTGEGSYFDYATIKYNSNGDTLWVRRYNGPGNGDDAASALVVDDFGNVYVTGTSTGSGTNFDYATIKYTPNGDTVWVKRFNGPRNVYDFTATLAVDDSGNVYVTGTADFYCGISDCPGGDYATIKYAPNGDTSWVSRYAGAWWSDRARALAVDNSGNVYVAGNSATIKYLPDGEIGWIRTGGGVALAVDDSGNVYVTGYGDNYITIKYTPDGDSLWVRRYSGHWEGGLGPSALALDESGNIYVTGPADYECYTECWAWNYATIKYSPNGDNLWVITYHGPGIANRAFALAVDDSGSVYVTGYSISDSSYDYTYDYATIKYVQYDCLAKPGDVTGEGSIFVPDVVSLINYIFRSQRAPSPLCRGDANADGTVSLSDLVYLINFIFKSGPAPVKSKECCL